MIELFLVAFLPTGHTPIPLQSC